MAQATMIRTTLGDVRSAVARVAGMTGMKVTDPRITERINEAQQELMTEGAWPGVVDRWHIVATDGHIVLPHTLDSLMQISIAGVPRTMKSPWYEFVADGPGYNEDSCECMRTWCDVYGILERGESCTVTPLPDAADEVGPWAIRVYPQNDEKDGAYVTIQGLDRDGLEVRSKVSAGSNSGEWINGVQLGISDGTSGVTSGTNSMTSGSSVYYSTAAIFASLEVFTKPPTNGYLRITGWNGLREVELSRYAPSETTPSYRRYFSPWLQDRQNDTEGCRIVRARCRRRFVPVAQETDVLIISNVLAIKEMVIAQNKREANEGEQYALHKQTAVDILKKEAMAYRGKSRIPGITFQRGFSVGALPGLR